MNFYGFHYFIYCSWPPVQQSSRLLIGLSRILLCLKNSSQITKQVFRITYTFIHEVMKVNK